MRAGFKGDMDLIPFRKQYILILQNNNKNTKLIDKTI